MASSQLPSQHIASTQIRQESISTASQWNNYRKISGYLCMCEFFFNTVNTCDHWRYLGNCAVSVMCRWIGDTNMGLVSVETTSPDGIPLIDFEECLKERKWWCFLLSSIFTFILGLLSVVLVRIIQSFMCPKVAKRKCNLQFCKNSGTTLGLKFNMSIKKIMN